jgi:hypothetical protein
VAGQCRSDADAAAAGAQRKGPVLNAVTVVLVVLVFLLVVRQREAEQAAPAPRYVVPGNPARGPEALYDPNTGQGGGLSTRQQIETGVGTLVGAGAGLYVCGGAPACAAAGGYIGGVAAPLVSHGAEEGAKGVAKGATAAWNATLGRLF